MPGRRVQAQHPAVANTVLNNVEFIQRLPADALDQVYEGRTLLQWAVVSGADDVADYLLDADVDASDAWLLAEHHGTLSALAGVFQAHGIVDGW